MRKIMGIDASTTTIAISVLLEDNDGYLSLNYYEYYKPNKKVSLFEMLSLVRQYITNKIEELNPDIIALEDILLFLPGRSSAKTIVSLAQLNRCVGLACFEKGKLPILLSVSKIRNTIKIEKKAPKKEEIPELLEKILNIKFPYVLLKKGKNKGTPAPESFDISDSISVALCCHKLLNKK
jgi:Holliday junction resolvasome RuvABC endonuclease subunit